MTGMIERQAAIDAALTFIIEYCGAAFDEDMQKMLCERFDALPSAEPKKGKWIEFSPKAIYECSLCHKYVATADIEADHFCPYCGAKMEADHE